MRFAVIALMAAASVYCESSSKRNDKSLARLGDIECKAEGIINQYYIPLSDCQAIYESGLNATGLYYINPDGKGPLLVYCDMGQLDGLNNGWTVIQRRRDGSFDFNRNWVEYRNGFGNLKSNFWLGLESIKRLTDTASYKLYIALQYNELDVKNGQSVSYAKYGTFRIGSETVNYKLSLGDYDTSSTANDSLSIHDGKYFSTKDRDNDNAPPNCAAQNEAGWWYSGPDCVNANLNGVWQSYEYSKPKVMAGKLALKNPDKTYSFIKTTVVAVRR